MIFLKVPYTPEAIGGLKDTVQFDNNIEYKRRRDALLILKCLDHKLNPISGKALFLKAKSIPTWYTNTSDYSGQARFLLKPGLTYDIYVQGQGLLTNVKIPNRPGAMATVPVVMSKQEYDVEEVGDTIIQDISLSQEPTMSRTLIRVKVMNLERKPLADEKIHFIQKGGTRVYYGQTGEDGKARFLLPNDKTWYLHFEYDLYIDSIRARERAHHTIEINYSYIGSKVLAERKRERERALAIRDSLDRIRAKEDSIYWKTITERNFLDQYRFNSSNEEVFQNLRNKAEKDRKEIQKDPAYYEKTGNEIGAVFLRNADRWNSKMIVTDLTGSMNPYMDQVLIWHALQWMNSERKRYLFFNDGDGQDDASKVIGRTGGLYFVESDDMKGLFETMNLTKRNGDGGDGPENDIEALLKASEKLKPAENLILIADNYSDVKDLELLSRLKRPVRIILCGVDDWVNEEYLEIARKTRGSVHTIHSDITRLSSLTDGKSITIDGKQYVFLSGKFVLKE